MTDTSDRDRSLHRIETLAVAISARFLPRIVGSLLDTQITVKQLKVLATLAGAEALTLSELAADFEVSLATMSGLLDKLAKRDLVIRTADAGDQRVRRLHLTPLGRTVVSELLAPSPHLGTDVMAGLSVTELQALEIGLAAINRELTPGITTDDTARDIREGAERAEDSEDTEDAGDTAGRDAGTTPGHPSESG